MAVLIAIGAGYRLVIKLTRFDLELGPVKRERKRDADRWDEDAPLSPERADIKSPTEEE